MSFTSIAAPAAIRCPVRPDQAVVPVGRYGLVADKIERIDAEKIMPELLDFEPACEWKGRRFMRSFTLREESLNEARQDCAP